MSPSRLLPTILWLAVTITAVSAAAADGVEGHWTGVAITSTGQASLSLTLRQDGPRVTGMFQGGAAPFNVEGMLTGNALILRFVSSRGQLHLTLSPDGRTITGDGVGVNGGHLTGIRLTRL